MGQDQSDREVGRRWGRLVPRTLSDTSMLVGMVAILLGGVISGLAWVRGEDIRELRELVQYEADARGTEDAHNTGVIRALERRTDMIAAGIREVETRLINRIDAMENKLGRRIDNIYLFPEPRVRSSGGNATSPVDTTPGGV